MFKKAKLFLVGITIFMLFILALAFLMSGEESTAHASTHRLDFMPVGGKDYIIVDTYTGVCYLFVSEVSGNNCTGLTVMLDADGSPLIYNAE